MKCLSEHRKLCNILLFIALFNLNFVSCDILLNSTTSNIKNSSVCEGDQCDNGQNHIVRDHRMLIMDYVQESKSLYGAYNDRLKHMSILYGIVMIAQENELNQRCYKEIMQIYDGINHKEVWAIKALDSSGQLGAGFLLGNNHWLGSEKGCQSVQRPLYVTLSNRFERLMKPDLIQSIAPFDMDYRMVYAKHYSPWQIEIKFHTENLLHIGLCLPKSCTNNEVHNLTQEYLNSRTFDAQNLFEFESDVLLVKDLNLRENFFTKKSVILLCVLLIIIFTIVLCAWNRDERISEAADQIEAAQCYSIWDRVLKCFSLQNNWKSLMDDTIAPNSIPVINGIRSISCFFILCFHMFWFSFYATSNPGVLFYLTEKVRYQWISNAALMVDSFFCISGFLVAYNFLRSEKQMKEIKDNSILQNVKLFMKMLLHRVIRLSPLYLVVGLLTEILTSYVVDVSKFWVHDRTDLNCQRYWWRNLLYIHNFFSHDELCMNWTWSMACEMQFFVIFTFILFLYAKNKRFGVRLFSAFSLFMLFTGINLNYKYKFLPSFDVLLFTGTELYISPWTRIMPYAIGVACGWFLNKYRQTFNVSDKLRNFLFFLATIMLLIVLHATIWRDMSLPVASLCIFLVRPVTAIAVSWFIITNACGYNCLVSKFFSARIFVRVNKLTYAIYLLNPLVISIGYGLLDSGSNVDPTLCSILILGVTTLTYLLAIGFSLLFEIPFYKLSNEILRGSSVATAKVKTK